MKNDCTEGDSLFHALMDDDIRVVNRGFAIRKKNTGTQTMEIGDFPMARRSRSVTYETGERNMNAHVVSNLKTTKMPRLATILIALMGSVSLCIAPPAFAQSADNYSGPPRSHTDWVQVPETNSDATSGGDGQVIEIPQSADAAQAAAPNSDDNSPARASNDGPGDEYAIDELGGLNDYAYGYYDPYWAWHPAPIYYYSRGHDCDGGNCGSRVGGHDSHPKPPLRTGPGTRPPGTASHPMPALGAHVSNAPAVASAPSGGFGNRGDFDRGGGFARSGFGNGGGFGGGRGFGGSGFGGAQGGFGHR